MYCTYIQHIPLQLGLAVRTTILYVVHLQVNKFTYIHKNNTLMFLSITNVLWSDQLQSTVQCHFQCRRGRCHFPSHFLWCPLQRCSSQSARSSALSPAECNGQPHRLTTHLCVFIQCACIHCNINIYIHCLGTYTQSEVAIGAETNKAKEAEVLMLPPMIAQ